jgi:hypothetical protein
MDQDNAIRGVDIERLSLLFLLCVTPGGIANVPKANSSKQASHVTGSVTLANLAVGFVKVEGLILESCDSRGILTSVLKQSKSVVDLLVDRCGGDDADNATH